MMQYDMVQYDDMDIMARYMVIKNNGNVAFVKIWFGDGELYTQVFREYEKASQKTFCFVDECITRFDNEYPEWAGVIEWEWIDEDVLYF